MDIQDQITLTSELNRIARFEDIRILREMCQFLECFSEYLLEFFDHPSEIIEDFNSRWNEPDRH